jgi:hypothetical protein
MIGFDIRLRRGPSEGVCHRWGWRIEHNMTDKSQGSTPHQADGDSEISSRTHPQTLRLSSPLTRVACLSAALRLVCQRGPEPMDLERCAASFSGSPRQGKALATTNSIPLRSILAG